MTLPRLAATSGGTLPRRPFGASAPEALKRADVEVAEALYRPSARFPPVPGAGAPGLQTSRLPWSSPQEEKTRMLSTFQESLFSAYEDRAVWRGVEDKEWLGRREVERKFAKLRHSTRRQWSSRERELARRRRLTLERAREEREQAVVVLPNIFASESEGGVCRDPPLVTPTLLSPISPIRKPFGSESLLNSSKSSHRTSVVLTQEEAAGLVLSSSSDLLASVEEPPTEETGGPGGTGSLLSAVKLKSSKADRLHSVQQGIRSKSRVMKHCQEQQFRVDDFGKKPWEEKLSLMRAFGHAVGWADREVSEFEDVHRASTKQGTSGGPAGPSVRWDVAAQLDAALLLQACPILGIVARCEAEENGLDRLCLCLEKRVDILGFSYDVVPKLRCCIRELRRPSLRQHFGCYEENSSGYISRQSSMKYLQKHCLTGMDIDAFLEMRAWCKGELEACVRLVVDVEAEAKAAAEKRRKGELEEPREVSFEQFESLVRSVEEQRNRLILGRSREIVRREHVIVDHGQEDLQDNLLWLCDIFLKAKELDAADEEPSIRSLRSMQGNVSDSVSTIRVKGLRLLLLELQLIPQGWTTAECLSHCHFGTKATLRFMDVVEMYKVLQKRRGEQAAARPKALFEKALAKTAGKTEGLSRDRRIEHAPTVANFDGKAASKTKGAEWDERQKTRAEELVAPADTIKAAVARFLVAPGLSINDAFVIIAELGLGPSNKSDQLDIRRAILALNRSESGSLSCNEFLSVVQRLEERYWENERLQLWSLAADLGIDDRYVFALREAHFVLCGGERGMRPDIAVGLADRLKVTMESHLLQHLLDQCLPSGAHEMTSANLLRFGHGARFDWKLLCSILAKLQNEG